MFDFMLGLLIGLHYKGLGTRNIAHSMLTAVPGNNSLLVYHRAADDCKLVNVRRGAGELLGERLA